MLLQLHNTLCRVMDATKDDIEWLVHLLSFQDQSQQFVRRGGKTVFNPNAPRHSLFCQVSNSFPAGFTGLVMRQAIKDRRETNLVDARRRPVEPDLSLMPSYLRDYQKEAVARAAITGRGILQMVTGSGKTQIACAMTSVVPCNWLLIAPEKDLMYNAARRYQSLYNDQAGLLGDGIVQIVPHFTCATFQTLANKINDPAIRKYLAGVDGLIIDEVHQIASPGFFSVAQSIDTYWRIGLSGTSLKRGDRRNLFTVAAIGNIIHKVGAPELIKLGYLSEAKISMVRHKYSSKAPTWQAAETECIIENSGRNRLICQIADDLGEAPGLIFVRKKRHGRILVRRLQERGIRTEFVWGDKNMAQRDDAIERLEQGDLDYIVCSTIFQTGTDIPCLRTLINAGGGKSEIANIQRLGRGLRRTDTKSTVLMLDILDIDALYKGLPSGNRWPARHATERLSSYQREGHSVKVVDLAS